VLAADRLRRPARFAAAVASYWTGVFPQVCGELRHWREQALAIRDPLLRIQALEALAERGNMEGAAAFCALQPRPRRELAVRAAVAFQAAYNYLDALSELPSARSARCRRHLHGALLAALDPTAAHLDLQLDCYKDFGRHQDDGYLQALVDRCRRSLCELPSYEQIAPAARRAAERVVCFQALNDPDRACREAIERWGREQIPVGSDLRWWETAASAGSSLGVHAMIAAAAEPAIDPAHVEALERAYFPWIGALHSLLDHLIDAPEDARNGQGNLIGCYASQMQAAERMALLTERSLAAARALGPAHRHELIVAAMAAFYLCSPAARTQAARPVAQAVLDALGSLARPALAVFNTRRSLERVYYASPRNGHMDTSEERFALLASPH
jgi:tetraprenyl-beta-curcumene synthase